MNAFLSKTTTKDRTTMKFRFASIGSLLATVLATLLFTAAPLAGAPAANAGTYHVYQCHHTYGIVSLFSMGWNYSTNFNNTVQNPHAVENCGGWMKLQASYSTGGDYAYWKSPALPGNLGVQSVDYSYLGDNGNGQTYAMARLCLANAYSAGPAGQCGAFIQTDLDSTSVWKSGSVGNCSTIDDPVRRCKAFEIDLGVNSQRWGGFYLNQFDFVIKDPDAPSAWQPHNGTLRNNNTVNSMWADGNYWNSGTKTVQVAALDSNSGGMKSTKIFFDGASGAGSPDHNFNHACDYRNWRPCPEFVSHFPSIDTAAFADGSHTATTRAVDAGDNMTDSTVSFKVDNTDPSDPSSTEGTGDGLQGYGATNDFDISWTNGAETTETATQSGISHVVLDLEPVNPGGSNPAPLVVPVGGSASGVSATIDSLSGVTLPEQAGYRYGVGVRDLAGNWSGNVSVDGSNNPTGVSIDPEDSSALTWNSTPPVAPDARANGWVSEADLLAGYSQEWSVLIPLGGVDTCGYATSVTPNQSDNPGTTINLVGNVKSWELPSNLTEGTHWVHIRSIGCNLLPAASTASSEVKVDRTDPVSSFAGVTAGKWYKDGSVVTIGATDALSGMEPAPSDQRFDKGAHLDYSINAVSPAEPARGGEAQLPVTGEGQKQLRFAAVDLAGNRNDDTVVNFGIDASDPTGYLEATDPDTPTLIRAPLADAVSGLETAIIEVRPEGGGDWTPLATGLADLSGAAVAGNPTSAMASARFPDTTLPEGRYLGRVRTYDQAENSLVTDRDKQGRRFIVDSGQMREHVGLSATLFKAKRTCKKKKGVKCIKKARGKVVFLGGKSNLTVGFKRGAVVEGFLVDASTKALARQPIEIYTQAKGKEEVLAGTTSTRPDGSYSFKLRPGVSRSVRVYFPGTETRRDTSERVTLGTGAKLKLRVSKKHARTGQTVTFSGTVTSFDRAVPASGKIIALQFYTAKKWRPAVAIARTDSRGRFKVKYKFDGGGNKARIVFRVMAPAEDGWGHTTSNSRRITMKLN